MPYLATAALLFVPVIYINSVTTIDYVLAIAFLISAFALILREKILLAAVMTGLAAGCRITSLAMLVPFFVMLVNEKDIRSSGRKILALGSFTLLTALCLYLPLWTKYGLDFLTYYDVPYPSVPKVIYKFFIETWGIAGTLALIFAVGILLFSKRKLRQYLFGKSVSLKYVIAWLIAIDLYIIAFLKLPMESGYLIPIIPFIILILCRYLYRSAFIVFAIMLIISSFTFSVSPVERLDASDPSAVSWTFNASGEKLLIDVLKGPQLTYESRRKNGIHFTNELVHSFDTITVPSAIITGRWYNQLISSCDTSLIKPEIISYADEKGIIALVVKNYSIYYLPKQDYYNQLMRGVEVNHFGAKPYYQFTYSY